MAFITVFHNNVPKYGIAHKVVVEKNVSIPGTFFDNHYICFRL